MSNDNLPQQRGGVTDDDLHASNTEETFSDLPTGEEEEQKPVAAAPAPAPAPAPADELPPELQGKTPAQLAQMYREAQSLIGRQGNELGDLRRTFDAHIKATLANAPRPAPAPAPKPVDEVDFFADPKKAVAEAIANHPELQRLRGVEQEVRAREVVRQQAENSAKFQANHADAGEILQDPEFQAWVGKSKVRQALLLKAHKQYDVVAADEVFGTWKELKAARAPAAPTDEAKAAAAAKAKKARVAAGVPTGGNASPTEGATASDKVYRRSEIVKLMELDPAKYERLLPEIQRAYEEGRVR